MKFIGSVRSITGTVFLISLLCWFFSSSFSTSEYFTAIWAYIVIVCAMVAMLGCLVPNYHFYEQPADDSNDQQAQR